MAVFGGKKGSNPARTLTPAEARAALSPKWSRNYYRKVGSDPIFARGEHAWCMAIGKVDGVDSFIMQHADLARGSMYINGDRPIFAIPRVEADKWEAVTDDGGPVFDARMVAKRLSDMAGHNDFKHASVFEFPNDKPTTESEEAGSW